MLEFDSAMADARRELAMTLFEIRDMAAAKDELIGRVPWDAASQAVHSGARRVREPRDDQSIKLETKWAALEDLVANPKEIDLVVGDLGRHYERGLESGGRQGDTVCMSGRTYGEMYNVVIKLRPEWASGITMTTTGRRAWQRSS